jgi:hypothetical protein
MVKSPYRTPARPTAEPPLPEPTRFVEIMGSALLVWLASLFRVCGVALGRARPDRELALALVLLAAFSVVIWKEIVARRQARRGER